MNLTKADPDDAFSLIPYEKGFLFLYYLEQQVGESAFQQILQQYIKKFRLKSVNYLDFKAVFETEGERILGQEKFKPIKEAVDWNHWVHEPGIPKIKFDYCR